MLATNREKGVPIAAGRVILGFKTQYVVSIERIDDGTTRITVKGFMWTQRSGAWRLFAFVLDRGSVSAGLLRSISKRSH